MIQDFYATLAQVSFTVLGLWFVVIQLRREEWRASPRRRLGARAVAIDFALPGVMSLLTLANPDSAALWRVSFVVFAGLGAAGLAVLIARGGAGREPAPGQWGQWVAVAIYGAVAVVALLAVPIAAGLGLAPLHIEAVLLSLLLLVGLNVAVGQLFQAV